MRISSTFPALAALGLAGVLAASCTAAPPSDPSRWDPKSARYRVAYAIAAARCNRQTPECESHSAVHFATFEECIAAKLPPSAAEADLAFCGSYPLRDHDLDECITQIRSGRCGTGIAAATACKGRNLCPWDSFAR
jgi:hypothetical protein